MFRWLIGIYLIVTGAGALAADVGIITHLTGTLSAQRADGSVRLLLQKSEIQNGDTLTTQRDSFARINFTDGSLVILRPNSVMRIEDYGFEEKNPQGDGIVMRLMRGGMRSITGLIGKRGNQDAYKVQTTTATIGIRGSSGDTLDCMQDCSGVTSKSGKLPPGVYHVTHTGIYIMETKVGAILLGVKEIGFSNDPNKPPVKLPQDPDLGLEELPFALVIGGLDAAEECVIQ